MAAVRFALSPFIEKATQGHVWYASSVVLVLAYPDPPLVDEAVALRIWTEADLPLIEEVSRDPHIPEITTVPSLYNDELGREWLERQWGRRRPDLLAPAQGFALAEELVAGLPESTDLQTVRLYAPHTPQAWTDQELARDAADARKSFVADRLASLQPTR